MYKIISRFLLPIFFGWCLIQPTLATAGALQTVRVGGTFYPMTAQGAFGAALDVAALAGRANPWITGLTIGYELAKFAVKGVDSTGAEVTMNVLPASMTQRPAANMAWSDWVYDPTTKIWNPPATRPPVSTVAIPGGYKDLSAYCATFSTPAAIYTGSLGGGGCSLTIDGVVQPGLYYPFVPQVVYTCLAGYVLSGSICNLSDASQVPYPSDNQPTVKAKADGTGFALDPRDSDNALAPPTIPNPIQGTGVVNGQNTRVTIEPQTGGGIKVTTEQEVINSDGSKTTFKQSVITAADGKVTNSGSANYPGGIPDQTSSTQPLASTTSPTIQFPTDYNREATQTDIKNELAAQGETSALAPSSDTASAQIKRHYDNHVDAQNITDRMAGVGLPSVPGFLFPTIIVPACRPIGWTFQGRAVSFDICPYVPTIKSIFAWVLNLIAAAMMFQMIMNFRAMRVRG